MSEETKRRPDVHDVLLIPASDIGQDKLPNGRTAMLRFEVEQDGTYKKPAQPVDVDDQGARKLYSIARPAEPDQLLRQHERKPDDPASQARGPVLAVLPLREDPGTEYGTCYLVNAENLQIANVWTENDLESTGTDAPTEELSEQAGFDLLLAGPQGKVFHVRHSARKDAPVECTPVELHDEVEIWSQLREGTVVGTVLWRHYPGTHGTGRVLPLVNVTSLKLPKGGKR